MKNPTLKADLEDMADYHHLKGVTCRDRRRFVDNCNLGPAISKEWEQRHFRWAKLLAVLAGGKQGTDSMQSLKSYETNVER